VSALTFLEERGDLIVQVAGLRQGYRRLKQPEDRAALIASLNERFQQREANDIARTTQVLAYAGHSACLTQYLLAYFGEKREPCGHCDRCAGISREPLPPRHAPTLGEADAGRINRLRGEGH